MPTLARLAEGGLRYNRFHTTALCSPTRVALLTGHNHHVNNAGAIMELATAFPGNTGVRPGSVTTLAEILRQNGYSTAAFGKYHETPPWEVSVSGPYDPLAHGLRLRQVLRVHRRRDQPVGAGHLRRRHPRRAPAEPRLPLHHGHDRPTRSAGSARSRRSRPTSPSTCTSRPARRTRRTTCRRSGSRSTRASSAAAGTSSARRPSPASRSWASSPRTRSSRRGPQEIPAWDDMSADQKRLFERQMETFAGFAEHTDHEVGRLVERSSRRSASSRTRSSSTSWATTARAPRAAPRAPTTR